MIEQSLSKGKAKKSLKAITAKNTKAKPEKKIDFEITTKEAGQLSHMQHGVCQKHTELVSYIFHFRK